MQDAMTRLRELREELNYSQEDIALVTGVRNKQVSQWETGKNLPSAISLAIYIRLVGASAHEIIDLIMKNQPDPQAHLVDILRTTGGKDRVKRAAQRLQKQT
jgi:transcriptional regulator with XRE-family HTH domain